MRKCWLATKTDSIVCLSWSLLRSNDRANSGCALPWKVRKRSWNTSSSVAISWQLSHSEDVCRRDAIMGRQDAILATRSWSSYCTASSSKPGAASNSEESNACSSDCTSPCKRTLPSSSVVPVPLERYYEGSHPDPLLLRRKTMWECLRVPHCWGGKICGKATESRATMKEGLQVP